MSLQNKIKAKYRLKKDLPELGAGAIFHHIEWDGKHPDVGNPGYGAMILAWINGDCQYTKYKGKRCAWCGDTFILPGQTASDTDFFELIERKPLTEKEQILEQIEELKERVKNLK